MTLKTVELLSTESRYYRRTFLKLTGGAAITGVLGANLSGSVVYAEALGKEKRDKMTPDEILKVLQRGNQNFSKAGNTSREDINEQKATAKGQYPSAVILSCIDSRAPAEVSWIWVSATSSISVSPAMSYLLMCSVRWNMP